MNLLMPHFGALFKAAPKCWIWIGLIIVLFLYNVNDENPFIGSDLPNNLKSLPMKIRHIESDIREDKIWKVCSILFPFLMSLSMDAERSKYTQAKLENTKVEYQSYLKREASPSQCNQPPHTTWKGDYCYMISQFVLTCKVILALHATDDTESFQTIYTGLRPYRFIYCAIPGCIYRAILQLYLPNYGNTSHLFSSAIASAMVFVFPSLEK